MSNCAYLHVGSFYARGIRPSQWVPVCHTAIPHQGSLHNQAIHVVSSELYYCRDLRGVASRELRENSSMQTSSTHQIPICKFFATDTDFRHLRLHAASKGPARCRKCEGCMEY